MVSQGRSELNVLLLFLQMINVTRLNPRLENTAFIYLIDRGGTLVPPNEAIAALNQLDDQEITLTLGHVVVIKAEGKLGSGDRSWFYVDLLDTNAFLPLSPSGWRGIVVTVWAVGRSVGGSGGRLPDLRNPYLCNRLMDFLRSKFYGIV